MQMGDSDKAIEEKLLRSVALLCASLVIGGRAGRQGRIDSLSELESDAIVVAQRFKVWIEEGR